MDKKMEAIGFRVSGNDGCKVRGLGLESKGFWQPNKSDHACTDDGTTTWEPTWRPGVIITQL